MSIGKPVGNVEHLLSNVRISYAYNHLKDDYRSLLSKGYIGKKLFNITKATKQIIKKGLVQSNMFSDMGLRYIGPIDGHNFDELLKALEVAKNAPFCSFA